MLREEKKLLTCGNLKAKIPKFSNTNKQVKILISVLNILSEFKHHNFIVLLLKNTEAVFYKISKL